MYSYNPYYYEFLAHHGVKGQKWGIRRYQPYTSGQKGVFKNLRRSYKSSVRQLKKERRKYEKEGDKLAVASINKDIKDNKKTYKSEKKSLADQFRKENWEEYKQDIVERGTEKEIKKIYTDLTNDQLVMAAERIRREKDLTKVFLRDVNEEYKHEKAMADIDRFMKKTEAVGKVATTAINVTNATKGMKELFKTPSAHEKEMERLEEEKAKASIRETNSTVLKNVGNALPAVKTSGTKEIIIGDTKYEYDENAGTLVLKKRKKKDKK